ncbi:MAG: hypothetical protein PHN42_00460 [Bacilli bacterium]|nr:hypothetical protein [Bacilli bacterium]
MILDFKTIDFCKLLVANMKLENIDKFNVNIISSELSLFYNDIKYQPLFNDLHINKLNEIENLKIVFFDMLTSGYQYFYQQINQPNIYYIALKESDALKISNLYKPNYQILMKQMVIEYKSLIDEKKLVKRIIK